MLVEQIYEAAVSFGGAASSELEALCGAALAELKKSLRDGLSPEDCGEVFVTAAAFTALAMQTELKSLSGIGVESYTAGSVSVRSGGSTAAYSAAKSLRAQAARIMAPFVRSEGFDFIGVNG